MFSLRNPFRRTLKIPRNSLPTRDWIDKQSELTRMTPDAWKINRYQAQFLFVCGEEMRKHPAHEHLTEKPQFLSHAFTAKRMALWKKMVGKQAFAVPFEDPTLGAPHTLIRGELYAVRPHSLVLLDTMRANGLQFVRKPISVIFRKSVTEWDGLEYTFNDSLKSKELRNVWMYVGIPDYWEEQLKSGIISRRDNNRTVMISHNRGLLDNPYTFSPVSTFEPKTPWVVDNYYWFTQSEHNG